MKSYLLRLLFKTVSLSAVIMVFFLSQVRAQDPHFSQFWNNPIYYNPGYIGLNPGARINLDFRDQWVGLPTSFKTYTVSADLAERSLPGSGGLGFLAVQDQAGTTMIKASDIGIGFSSRIPLQENMVTQFGVMASYVEKQINWNNLVFTDQLHAVYGNILPTAFVTPSANKVSFPDFSVGGVYRFTEQSARFQNVQGTIGVAYHHIFRPNESFLGLKSPLPSRLTITGDLLLEIDDGKKTARNNFRSGGAFKFDPGFILEKQAEFSTMSIGLNVLKSNVYAGVWLRNEKFQYFQVTDLLLTVGINAPFGEGNHAKIMYTYDFIATELRSAAHASHEISLIIDFEQFKILREKSRSSSYRNSKSTDLNYSSF